MKSRTWFAITALFLLAFSAQAADPHALAKYLQLTPDQVAAWKQIHTETAAAVKPLAEQAQGLREQIRSSTDPAKIGQLTLSLRALRDQIRDAREEGKGKLLATLTPEQKTKFEAFEAAMKFVKGRRPR